MDWVAYITTINMAIAGISAVTGLLLGWIIWGGQRKYIRELEDSLAVTRSRTQNVALNGGANDGAVYDKTEDADDEGDLDDDRIDGSVRKDGTLQKDSSDQDASVEGEPVDESKAYRAPQTLSSIQSLKPTQALKPKSEADRPQETLAGADIDAQAAASQEVSRQNLPRQSLQELSDELRKIRTLLKAQPYSETDDLKEHLDEADHSIKKANGRVGMILRSFDKPTADE